MNDSSQESETTLPVVNISSPEDGRCNTRLSSSPSPTRSSGSPDSGYNTIELEPGSRALSLARLAVRVREGRVAAVRVGEGEGGEVVAALHLLARLLDGTWGEEEAKVCLTKPCHHNLHNVNHQVGFQIAPILVECYNGAEETQVRKAALTCLVSLCLQVSLITCSNTDVGNEHQVGEDHLAAHLAGLPGAKRKLLSLHLHRSLFFLLQLLSDTSTV